MTTRVQIVATPLTDGSEVFAVEIVTPDGRVAFDAISERDATRMSEQFVKAIEANTNETVSVLSFNRDVRGYLQTRFLRRDR